MPPAVDFILYCLGISAILVSTGVSIKLVTGTARSRTSKDQSTPKWEPVPDPTTDGLENRLRTFQSARYASPLVRRQLSADAGPRPPQPRPPIPIRRPTSPKTDDKVVPLPVKMKKEPDKED